MSKTTTLDKIRRVAEQRQDLWSKASSLTAADRAAIAQLTRELEALWEQHRAEIAAPRPRLRRRMTDGAVPARSRTAA